MELTRTPISGMKERELTRADDLTELWNQTDLLTFPDQRNPRYLAGYACSDRMVEEVLRLRYRVFNLELGEGLAESVASGLDRDEFDDQMTHLVVIERATGFVIGTYRLQTVEHALRHGGIYSAREFDFEPLRPIYPKLIECGRACLEREHRSMRALMFLWKGITSFMELNGKSHVFGCCSLTSQDTDEGWRALRCLRSGGYVDDSLFLKATPEFSCGDPARELQTDLGEPQPLPKLFSAYLRLGSRVVSEPAIDREFGTIDFLILQDLRAAALSSLKLV